VEIPWINRERLSNLELNSHFHNEVDRRSVPARRREAPLFHRLHGAFVKTRIQAPENLDVAHAAIPKHDDLEEHVAIDAPATSVFGIVGLYFLQEPGRVDS
jgi:hypothetical protein